MGGGGGPGPGPRGMGMGVGGPPMRPGMGPMPMGPMGPMLGMMGGGPPGGMPMRGGVPIMGPPGMDPGFVGSMNAMMQARFSSDSHATCTSLASLRQCSRCWPSISLRQSA